MEKEKKELEDDQEDKKEIVDENFDIDWEG